MNASRSPSLPSRSRVTLSIALGQIGFAVFLAVCVALHPGFVLKSDEGGMSNYGVHLKTAVPYTLSLGLPAFFSFRAAGALKREHDALPQFQGLLRVYGLLALLTLLSTYSYSLNTGLRDIHIVIGSALTVFLMAASTWIFVMLRTVRWFGALWALELVGFVLAALTIVGALHLLFVSEVLCAGAYSVFLIYGSKTLLETVVEG